MIGKYLPAAVAGAALMATAAYAQTKAADTSGTPEERAEAMLEQMTTAEKLVLVKGYFGTDFPSSNFTTPPEARAGSAGYVPGIERLGIPGQWEADAGMGVATQGGAADKLGRTALPSGLAVAASWDPEIAYEGGRMIGRQARADGFNVLLGGGANLIREPRNGRNFEYPGEDPLLAGVIAGAAVRGVQSNHIVSTVKHYALNAQETDRGQIDAVLGEDDLRNSDLLAFQIAIERGNPGSIMCAYNKVNTDWACENKFLLTDVLRDDWDWKGYVMSDWGAAHSTAKAANAGLDQESGFGLQRADWFGDKLAEAVRKGDVSGKRLDAMARHVLHAMFEQGLVDYPFDPRETINFGQDEEVSRLAAEAGAVLLKNEGGILPLAASARTIAIIGGHADKGVLSGGGSSQVYPGGGRDGGNAVPGIAPTSWPGPVVYYPSSPLEELRKALPETTFVYVDGTDPAAARSAAADADMAIVFANQWTSESIDTSLTLPDDQDALIAAAAAGNPNTVVVLQTGGPVFMPWLGQVKGVLEAWFPGRAGGAAIANLLTGAVNPSGHLPVTFPASLDQLPFPGEPRKGEAVYNEGAAVGYKWFDKTNAAPLFPFGHGLSYTSFEMGDFKVAYKDGDRLVATVSMTNTGAREGGTVLQVYGASQFWEAPRRLIGFHKFHLKPGETQQVEIAIDPRLMANFRKSWNGWVIEKGDYVISAGISSRALLANVMIQSKQRYLLAGWKPGDDVY
jgi:beta-glucosidase